MSGGSQQQQTGPPSWMQPYYTYALGAGKNLASGPGPQYYPGQQVAPLQGLQNQGLSSIQGAAQNNGATNSALRANQLETSGALLSPNANPYLGQMFQTAGNQIQNRLSSEFAGAGSNIQNSAPVQNDQLSQLASQMYGQNYQAGLQAMTGAQALEPGLAQTQYLPGQELMAAGGTQQNQLQNQIDAEMQKYNYQQTLPYNQLSWYSSLLGQNGSPFSSSTATMHNNRALTAGGGALAGAATGAELGSVVPGIGTGIGAAGGAVLGGLMGLF